MPNDWDSMELPTHNSNLYHHLSSPNRSHLEKQHLRACKYWLFKKNIVNKYIDSKPHALRTIMVIKSRVLGFHLIDIYCNRPHEYEDLTFTDYFKRFDMEKICQRNVPSFRKDKFGFYIYETHKIMRFTGFHTTHNSDALFFNILIHTIPFRNENDLLSPTNSEKIYIRECQDHGIISNLDAIQEYLLQYAHRGRTTYQTKHPHHGHIFIPKQTFDISWRPCPTACDMYIQTQSTRHHLWSMPYYLCSTLGNCKTTHASHIWQTFIRPIVPQFPKYNTTSATYRIRDQRHTQHFIDNDMLSHYLDATTTILCSHHEDATMYNDIIFKAIFVPADFMWHLIQMQPKLTMYWHGWMTLNLTNFIMWLWVRSLCSHWM